LVLILGPALRTHQTRHLTYTTLFRSMAGLALFGDLVAPLSDVREVQLTRRLESVKILPPNGFAPTDPKSYGPITQAAAARAEIGDRNSTRLNSSHVKNTYAVFCMKE